MMRHLRSTTVVVLVLAFRACVIDGKGCQNDRECDSNQACENSQCVNPCQFNPPCAANSKCQVSNHLLQCLCHPGFTGNPYVKCSSMSGTTNLGIGPKTTEFWRPQSGQNKYHAVTSFKTDWSGALQHCQSQGQRLATVRSWEENSQILQVIALTKEKDGHFWTAGTDQYGTSNWIWDNTGEPFTFTYWHNTQPNNLGWREHCMAYWGLQVGYKWNDRECEFKGFFICEEYNNNMN